MTHSDQPLDIVILLPIYNDWECAEVLIAKMDACLEGMAVRTHLIFLDDWSKISIPCDLVKGTLKSISSIESLRLRRNLGSQRAIAIGLCFVNQERPCDAVLVMDADGEDRPEDVPRLIQKFAEAGKDRVIFAERIRRSESAIFRLCYFGYRWLHRLLTGISVRVGNFSIVPFGQLATLAVVSDLWNHYAASIFKARISYEMLPTDRGFRLCGKSKLNFVGLIVHGLCAISVFIEIVGVRLTIAVGILSSLMLALLGAVLAIRLGTNLAVPGWATSAAGLLLILLSQMFTVVIGLTLTILFNRNNLHFLPIRDYRYFVGGVQKIYDQGG
jgi:polyisoprenyl-phosphate glycosyltransferase